MEHPIEASVMVAPSKLDLSDVQRATFAAELNTKQTVTVTVAVASGNTSVATVNPKSLTIARANWNHSQRLSVTGCF